MAKLQLNIICSFVNHVAIQNSVALFDLSNGADEKLKPYRQVWPSISVFFL